MGGTPGRGSRPPQHPQAPMKALFDTNILIDYLSGIEAARDEIERHTQRQVSVVTWMAVLAGPRNPAEEEVIELFLRDFRVIELTRTIARGALGIRRANRIRLPDAIIWSSARIESALLVTTNTKAFPRTDPGVRIPY
jgi:predicted nucleic acid-binding protein